MMTKFAGICVPSDTHSLTAALDQLRVVASSISNDLGLRSGQHQQTGQCLLPLVAAMFFVDDPADASSQRREECLCGLLLTAAVLAKQVCSPVGDRSMWPNNEWRLSAIRDGSPLISFSHWLLCWIPCHTIWYQGYDAVPAYEKIGSCHCLLYALSTFQSHLTLPTAQERCRPISWAELGGETISLCWRQTLSSWAIMEPAMPRRLCISG